jgi:hypothetical protein
MIYTIYLWIVGGHFAKVISLKNPEMGNISNEVPTNAWPAYSWPSKKYIFVSCSLDSGPLLDKLPFQKVLEHCSYTTCIP